MHSLGRGQFASLAGGSAQLLPFWVQARKRAPRSRLALPIASCWLSTRAPPFIHASVLPVAPAHSGERHAPLFRRLADPMRSNPRAGRRSVQCSCAAWAAAATAAMATPCKSCAATASCKSSSSSCFSRTWCGRAPFYAFLLFIPAPRSSVLLDRPAPSLRTSGSVAGKGCIEPLETAHECRTSWNCYCLRGARYA